MLAVMAVIVVAVAIPSYLSIRDRRNDSAARAQVQQAVEAIETYRAERGAYAGVSVAALVAIDPDLRASSLELVWPISGGYCIEAGAGGRTWHAVGPVGAPIAGPCS